MVNGYDAYHWRRQYNINDSDDDEDNTNDDDVYILMRAKLNSRGKSLKSRAKNAKTANILKKMKNNVKTNDLVLFFGGLSWPVKYVHIG